MMTYCEIDNNQQQQQKKSVQPASIKIVFEDSLYAWWRHQMETFST